MTGSRGAQDDSMIFSSTAFLAFFSVFYLFYLILRRRLRAQNLLLVIASYTFYAYWDRRFLLVLGLSTLGNYLLGAALHRRQDQRSRQVLLRSAWVFNLGMLVFFKYAGFFSASLAGLLSTLGLPADPNLLRLVMPLGLSFYALQNLGYVIDIAKGRSQPARNLLEFAVFASFFPQLLAGPIQRSASFLRQIENQRQLSAARIDSGLFLILWGLVKKLVIADNVALIANQIFDHSGAYAGLDILIGMLAFSIQIYGDFSGYSDIARGLGFLMGFELPLNFRLPYFAVNPGDFWARWHITLSSWLRDYIFFPLRSWLLRRSRNRAGVQNIILPAMITMLVSGFWHGSGWNFLVWGLYHGAGMTIHQLISARRRTSLQRLPPWASFAFNLAAMSVFTVFGWLIFRAANLNQAFSMLSSLSLQTSAESSGLLLELLFYAAPLLIIQILQLLRADLLFFTKNRLLIRVVFASVMLLALLVFGARQSPEFFYFRF